MQKSENHTLTILYQSLEFPLNFVKPLQKSLSSVIKNFISLENPKNHEKVKDFDFIDKFILACDKNPKNFIEIFNKLFSPFSKYVPNKKNEGPKEAAINSYKENLKELFELLGYSKNMLQGLVDIKKILSNIKINSPEPTEKPSEKSSEYHNKVEELLNTYIHNLKLNENIPDIIALGEYTPPTSKLKINEKFFESPDKIQYNLGGFVTIDNKEKGTRGMTILYRANSHNINRITIHNKTTSDDDLWLNKTKESYKEAYGLKIYEDAREKMREKWRNVISSIGSCAEIMFRNRYLAIAHVKECGKAAQNNARTTMECAHFRILGDCNFSLKPEGYHENSKIFGKIIAKSNSNCNKINGFEENNDFPIIQAILNIPGFTTYAAIHDGYYDFLSCPSEKVEIIGSFWPITTSQNKKSIYTLLSDHKGFLIRLTTNSTNNADNVSIKTNASLKNYLSEILENSLEETRQTDELNIHLSNLEMSKEQIEGLYISLLSDKNSEDSKIKNLIEYTITKPIKDAQLPKIINEETIKNLYVINQKNETTEKCNNYIEILNTIISKEKIESMFTIILYLTKEGINALKEGKRKNSEAPNGKTSKKAKH